MIKIVDWETWYNNKLQKYFDNHYGKYEYDIEWFVNPAENIWRFIVPEYQIQVILTCDERGIVTEKRLPIGGDSK